jgi:signal transduction histidine kinase
VGIAKSLSARMLLFSTAAAVLLAAAFVVLILATHTARDAGREALRSQKAITAGEVLEKSVLNLDNGLRAYIINGRTRSLRPYVVAKRAWPAELGALRGLIGADPAERAALRRIGGEITDYIDLWAEPLIAVARDRPDVARSIIGNVTGRERIDGVRQQFAALFGRERAVAAARQSNSEDRATTAVRLGVLGIGVLLVLTVALAIYVRRSVIRPIQHVAAAAERVAAGDLRTRVPENREDELGTLARDFNKMTASLETRTAELERSNRDLEDFASVASHDLQGPLVTISMLAETVRRRVGGQEAELVEHIQSATDRLRVLVRDLLAYSKLGRTHPQARHVELEDVFGNVLENLAGPIQEADAEISLDPELPIVRGDMNRLCQVMQNLVGNALKFGNGERPRVVVRNESADGRAHVSITDNGIGFAPEEAARIFRPFHRLHGEDRFAGSGIGLAICERIVLQHGGRIWADSRKGEGAVFHVELPLAGEGPLTSGGS